MLSLIRLAGRGRPVQFATFYQYNLSKPIEFLMTTFTRFSRPPFYLPHTAQVVLSGTQGPLRGFPMATQVAGGDLELTLLRTFLAVVRHGSLVSMSAIITTTRSSSPRSLTHV